MPKPPVKAWGRSPLGPRGLCTSLHNSFRTSLSESFVFHPVQALCTCSGLPHSWRRFPLPYFSPWLLRAPPSLPSLWSRCPVLNAIPSWSCWVQIWKCGLMGDPELMAFPPTKHFSDKLLSPKGGNRELRISASASGLDRRWDCDKKAFWGFKTQILEAAALLCPWDRGSEGGGGILWLLPNIPSSPALVLGFACGVWPGCGWVFSWPLSPSGFGTWGSLPCFLIYRVDSSVGFLVGLGEHCRSCTQEHNPSTSQMQTIDWDTTGDFIL